MARCELRKPAEPEAIPPLPAEGGSYVLTGGEWLAVQQTAPAGAEPAPAADDPAPAATDPAPNPED